MKAITKHSYLGVNVFPGRILVGLLPPIFVFTPLFSHLVARPVGMLVAGVFVSCDTNGSEPLGTVAEPGGPIALSEPAETSEPVDIGDILFTDVSGAAKAVFALRRVEVWSLRELPIHSIVSY